MKTQTNEEKCFALLNQSGLNWSVEKEQLQSISGRQTESHGIFKKEENDWLGTVGKEYELLQNSELAMILLQATEGLNLEITRGGELKSGKKVYLQAQLPEEMIGKSNIQRWITCLNSHDGSTSVGFGSSNTVVVCQNTFYRAYGELQKFRHTTTMKARIELAQLEMQKTLSMDNNLMTEFKKMADLPLRDEAIERVLSKIFKVDASTPRNEITTQKENKIADFADALNTSIIEQGSTVWALFNGVTRYINHVTAPSDIVKKMDYLMLSGGARIMNEGFELIKAYTDENTPKQKIFEMSN